MDQKIERMVDRLSGTQVPVKRRQQESDAVVHKTSNSEDVSSYDVENDCVLEPSRKISILDRCQVLVVGAGPGGISAAVGARRAGADVILCERYGCFGGVITTVGMETIGWYRYEGCTNDSQGIGIEMERLAESMGASTKWPYNDSQCLDADFFKVVADHLIREAGVRPLLHCMATSTIVQDGAIKGIITESKSGRQAILAERVIDCTGDADIAHFCGAEYTKIPRDKSLGMTTVFGCSAVDTKKFVQYADDKQPTYKDWDRTWKQDTSGKESDLRSPYLDLEFETARKNGVIPDNDRTSNIGGSWSSLTYAGEANNLNLAHVVGRDATDVKDLTAAEMEGRQQAMDALVALKKTVPGFENAKLRTFGTTIGVRDSRKIVGKYNLTEADVRGEARFKDSIGIFPEFVDGYNILVLPTTGRYFEVPYGCLQPVGIDNLLVAGRCVAGDRGSHAAMRNMMACTVTGQGAGVAAAVSVKQGQTTSNVNIKDIQQELVRQGVRIH